MKFLLFLCTCIYSIFAYSQSVELDNTRPSLKVIDAGSDVGIELGYYNSGGQELGYHLSIKDQPGTNERIHFFGGNQSDSPFLEFLNPSGDPAIRFFGEGYGPSQLLGRIITDQLEIKAGSDLAEYFDFSTEEDMKPGMIASIDPAQAGKLQLSDQAYDQKVVGIVSGANGLATGMFMGQQGSIADGAHPIALTGRAYVHVSNENGKINPGDFLTTSSRPGYAMRVKKLRKAKGAIIGKAMSEIDDNGFVLVLINLQ